MQALLGCMNRKHIYKAEKIKSRQNFLFSPKFDTMKKVYNLFLLVSIIDGPQKREN